MKRLIAVWTLCLAMLLGSFGILVLEDRQMNVPLPYSIPIAFVAMLGLSPLLLVVARLAPARAPRPRVVYVPAPATNAATAAATTAPAAAPTAAAAASTVAASAAVRLPPRRRRAPEGVVLLDFSAARRSREQAA